MRISPRRRYALRSMADLAQHGDHGPVTHQDILADYLPQLFMHLQAEGLVEGVKGHGGEYRLTRDFPLIRAGGVVRAVEGPVAVVHCTLHCPDEGHACRSVDRCVAYRICKQLLRVVMEVLDSVTLKDLTDGAKILTPQEPSCVHGCPMHASTLQADADLLAVPYTARTGE